MEVLSAPVKYVARSHNYDCDVILSAHNKDENSLIQ